MDVSEWFPVNAGLKCGFVMSRLLFNVYTDGVVRVVKARVLGKSSIFVSVLLEFVRFWHFVRVKFRASLVKFSGHAVFLVLRAAVQRV